MPGGALVSAPLVEEGAKSSVISSGEKTVINYWFRHIWEPVSPIYPEMPMNAAILGVSIPFIVSVQWPVSVAIIVSGIIFLLPLIRVNGDSKLEKSFKFYLEALQSVLPLVLVILLILVLKLSIILSIAAGILYVIFVKRVSFQKAIKSIDLKFLFKILFLMFSIFYLKYTVIDSNVITGVYKVLEIYNVPNFIILFFLPFIVGIMTGASTATFGVSYPLLLPIIRSVNIIPLNLFIAFVGGWLGIMLTPTHLCLSLSIEYFSAKFKETYIILIKNLAFVFLLSVLWMLVLKFSR
jgi:integral membrane protein (TIGR00529 family)